jgi:hypothetical protein
MKYLTGLPFLLIVLASCHKTNKATESGLLQQWKLSEWDVSGPGTARYYPGPDTTIVLDLASNGSYNVQINGNSYSSGTFRISNPLTEVMTGPRVIFGSTVQLKPDLGMIDDDFYSISGGTLTIRAVLISPGFNSSYIFKPVHL